MTIDAIVSTASGGQYRVNVGGSVSAEIPALLSAYRLEIDFDAKMWEQKPPAVGDQVLCFFPGAAYVDGCILGLLGG